jgi:small subunit ribosomal protein S35
VRELRNALQGDTRIDDTWEHKFKLLCGPRYNFETDVVHMSCDQHPYPAQNKRWLSDKLDEMIQLATVLPLSSPEIVDFSRPENHIVISQLIHDM